MRGRYFISVFLFGLSLLMARQAFHAVEKRHWSYASGRVVHARLEKTEIPPQRDLYGRGDTKPLPITSFSVAYSYEVGGKVYGGRAVVDGPLSEGSAVSVYYDPDHPRRSTLDGQHPSLAFYIFCTALFFLGGVAVVGVTVRPDLNPGTGD